jgi:molybdate transport system substrate-binding protein
MKQISKSTLGITLLMLFLISACGTTSDSPMESQKISLTISAAASLSDALIEIQTMFQEENPHIDLTMNFGSSGTLKQQILQGAPVDLFFSASNYQFDVLIKKGLIDETHSKPLLSNELVLITPTNATNSFQSFEDLESSDVRRIAIGIPESVPVGTYAQETLMSLGLWEKIKDKLVLSKDVRQVLTYVETGNVDAGIVYRTDALLSSKVKVIMEAEPSTHSEIMYPIGIIKRTQYLEEAQLFYTFLEQEEAIQVFEKYGFKILGE